MNSPASNQIPDLATRAAIQWLGDRMIEDIIPDYADGLYDDDSEARAAVEEIIRTVPAARDFHARYIAALASRTDEQWKAEAEAMIARIHSLDSTSPMPVETHESEPISRLVGRTPASGIIRKRQWFSGLLGEFPELQPALYGLSRASDVKSQTWKLELAKLGLLEGERCARLPWAGPVLQISRTNSKDGNVTYFAHIERSDDERPHGVLLVRIRVTDGQEIDVRLTKNEPKKRFRTTGLPVDPKALRIEVAIA